MESSDNSKILFQEAFKFFEETDYEKTLEKLKEVFRCKPDYSDAWNLQGLALQNLGRHEDAINSYDKVTEILLNYSNAWFDRGFSLYKLGRYEAAIACYDKAIELKSDYPDTLFNRGNALANLKHYDDAIASYDKVIELKPDDSLAWIHQGIALANLSRYDEAIKSYDKAIEFKPDYSLAWNNRGVALDNLSRYDEAIKSYDKAIELKSDYIEAWDNKGLTLANLSRYDEAIKSYDKAIEIFPSNSNTWFNRGFALANLKRYDEAIASYDKAIKLKEDDSDAWINRGVALDNLKRYDGAIASYDKAIEFQPDYSLAWSNRGISLANLGRYEEAIASYDKAIKLKEDYPKAWNNQGIALANLGRYEDAITSYDKVIELKEDDQNSWINRGVALANLGRYEEAIASYDKAIELKEDDPDAWHYRGNALDNLGRHKEAITNYKKAIELKKYNSYAYFDLGYALTTCSKHMDAIESYEKAIKIDPNYPYPFFNLADYYWSKGDFKTGWKYWQEANRAFNSKEWLDKVKKERNVDNFQYFGYLLHEFYGELKKSEKYYLKGYAIDKKHTGILTGLIDLFLEKSMDRRRDRINLFYAKVNGDEAYRKAKKYYRDAQDILESKLINFKKEITEVNGSKVAKIEDKYIPVFKEVKILSIFNTLLSLGKLSLKMEDYKEARQHLQNALHKEEELSRLILETDKKLSSNSIRPQNSDLAEIHSSLGIVSLREGDLKDAIKYFEKAHKLNPENLTIWSNLAEAYFKIEQFETAETEFKKILKTTFYHVESQIGIGETYVAMGDAKDPDFHKQAIQHFSNAIQMSKTRNFPGNQKIICSKRLRQNEIAAVYYSRGYARVQLYEKSQGNKENRLLREAVDDFKTCLTHDPEHHKAERAIEKVQKTFTFASEQGIARFIGSFVIAILSILVFALSQYFFWKDRFYPNISYLPNSSVSSQRKSISTSTLNTTAKQKDIAEKKQNDAIAKQQIGTTIEKQIDTTQYILLTFGSLTFIVISLYLPQLVKLKIAGIELEKSVVDQIKVTGSLGISK